jgi:GNAT superfamily N-acetyltransferase
MQEQRRAKMTVSPTLRNRGLGRMIILAAIEHARHLGARSLYLGSSTRLANAVHLYESVGFRHVPAGELGDYPYARADVFMSYPL